MSGAFCEELSGFKAGRVKWLGNNSWGLRYKLFSSINDDFRKEN